MIKLTFVIRVALFATILGGYRTGPVLFAQSQTGAAATQQVLSERLTWMAGEWEGEGVSAGEHEFIGKMSVVPELDGQALLIKRESMNKSGGPSGGKQELMLVGFGAANQKIVMTMYDSKNYQAIYVGELKQNEVVFSNTTLQSGYVDRRSFRLLQDGQLAFVIEGSSPGKAVSKSVEINFKKKP